MSATPAVRPTNSISPLGALASPESGALPVEALIAKAIEHDISVEGLERLLAMRQALRAEAAQEAFFVALAAFQGECPIVPKLKTATGTYSYRYAPLDDIVERVQPFLVRHGLSHTFQARFEELPEPAQVVVCIVHHVAGHSEASEFRAPVDAGARMNVIQKHASSLTYAKRYAFCNALGILTGDEDDDGRGAGHGDHEPARPRTQRPEQAERQSAGAGGVTAAQEAELRALNETLGDRRWSPAMFKAKTGKTGRGYAVTKAELETIAAAGRPPSEGEQGKLV